MFFVLPSILVAIIPPLDFDAPEASATSALRTLNEAERRYAEIHQRGYTDGLNRMGEPAAGQPPDADNADLVDHKLAGRLKGGSNR